MLFELIKSLSKSEKRYFKLHFSQQGAKKNYVRLFDAIDKQNVYDEQAIKAQFAGHRFIKQLHVTKNYLRALILKSLRNYHAEISKAAKVKDILRNIEILFHKELYTHCEAELLRAERLAVAYELFESQTELLTWKRKIAQTKAPHDYEIFLEIMRDQKRAIEQLGNINQYWQLATRISKETISRSNETVAGSEVLSQPSHATSLEARVLHYNARYFQSLQQEKREQAEDTLYELVAYLEQYPQRINEAPGLYASSINNLVSFLIFQKKYEPALSLVQQAKSTYERWRVGSEKKTLFKQIMRTYNIELEIYRDTGAHNQHKSFIADIESFVKENRHKMPKSYLISFWFQLANIYFVQHKYDQALIWINELLNTRYRNVRPDLQIHARMMNLMIHLEQQNLFVLRYFVDSTRRYLKKQRSVALHETILLRFFSSIARTPVMEYKEKFQQLNRSLFPSNSTPLITGSEDYIDYQRWIEEHL